METETIRHLANAVDALRAATQATKSGTVDDLCGSAEHALRAAALAAIDSVGWKREPTDAELAAIRRAKKGIA